MHDDQWTDDYTRRSDLTPITSATINGEWETVSDFWSVSYEAIAHANTVLLNLDRTSGIIPQSTLDKFAGNAYFVRASMYAKLISLFGDVVYYTDILDINEAFTLSRTSKADVLKAIYDDYDAAAAKLPLSYGDSENKHATKGAALAMKARIALYMGDWTVARNAAQACMNLGVYKLYEDFRTLFLSKTKNPNELIFGIPRSQTFNQTIGINPKQILPRNAGGFSNYCPSWELFCSFLCVDGLPIDKSPLYDPRNPFKNRDPRCTATIVEFQTNFLGFMYQPHPDSLFCYNFNKGMYVKNNDNRANAQYASYNGLLWKKIIDEDWLDYKADNDILVMRYADVLLMYAEAKIELGEIDQSVLDAINQVRARAYKANYTYTSSYPAVATTNQTELRKIVRMERRMEFAFEGLRYMDIIRWRIAEKVLNRNVYGMLDVADLRTKVVNKGLWFFPMTPVIDEDGTPDLSPMYNAGLIKQLAIRSFDASKQYLWPVPTKEILINSNLTQNPNY